MSLINDALKRTQQLRTVIGEGGPSSPPPLHARDGTRDDVETPLFREQRSSKSGLFLAAATVVVLLFVVVFLLMRDQLPFFSPQEAPAASVVLTTAQQSPISTIAPVGAVSGTSTTGTTPVPQAAPIPQTPASTEPVSPDSGAPPTVDSIPETRAAPPSPIHAVDEIIANPSARPALHVQDYVYNLNLNAIMPGRDRPRVLIDNRIYHLNDDVGRGFTLRIVEINPEGILLRDSTGAIYRKGF